MHRHVCVVFLALLAGGLLVVGCAGILEREVDLVGEDAAPPAVFLAYNADSDVKFPHDVHSQDCASCHPGIDPEAVLVEDVKDPSTLMRPAKNSCFDCHERGADCATCHERMEPSLRPPSHDVAFLRRHEKPAAQSTARCDWCHGEPGTDNGCSQCHSTMKPIDHGGSWIDTGHGRSAVHDRDRCWVCHRSDQCSRCHSQPPPTHTELFRVGFHGELARRNLRSCFVCHQFERTCAPCHQ